MEARLSALFESRLKEMEKQMRDEMEKQRVEGEKQMNDKMEKQRVESEKQRIEIESLRSNMARVESDNTHLTSTVTRLLTDLSEVHDDLRILHPLPYARLHFQKCINHQLACNDAVNAFIDQHTLKVINVTPSLSSQLQELKRELKKAWDARFAASHLCDPPPTLANVLHIMAERGFTNEVMRCMNLNQATRSCKMLQKVMREVKGKYG